LLCAASRAIFLDKTQPQLPDRNWRLRSSTLYRAWLGKTKYQWQGEKTSRCPSHWGRAHGVPASREESELGLIRRDLDEESRSSATEAGMLKELLPNRMCGTMGGMVAEADHWHAATIIRAPWKLLAGSCFGCAVRGSERTLTWTEGPPILG
jgi:hypothetical protein